MEKDGHPLYKAMRLFAIHFHMSWLAPRPMKKHPLLSFFLLVFGISWGIPGLALLLAAQTGAFTISLEAYWN